MRRFQPVRCQASMRSVWTSRTCSAGRSSLRSHHERRHRSATLRAQLRESRRRVAPARSVDPAKDQDAEVAESCRSRGTDVAGRIHHAGRRRVAARAERRGERRRCRSGAENAADPKAAAIRGELARVRAEIDARVERSQEERVFLALPQLCSLFGLSSFERDAIVICMAPELRRKYDRLYAYLQDDITRKRPSVDLILELLCDTEAQRWSARKLLGDSATLLQR